MGGGSSTPGTASSTPSLPGCSAASPTTTSAPGASSPAAAALDDGCSGGGVRVLLAPGLDAAVTRPRLKPSATPGPGTTNDDGDPGRLLPLPLPPPLPLTPRPPVPNPLPASPPPLPLASNASGANCGTNECGTAPPGDRTAAPPGDATLLAQDGACSPSARMRTCMSCTRPRRDLAFASASFSRF